MLTLLAFIAAWLLLGRDGGAQPRTGGTSYRLSLENRHGEPLRAFELPEGRFVLGTLGERYRIRVENLTSRRVEVVLSVDGRDVITGDLADPARHRGMVIPPYSSTVVEGFRRSLGAVAAFRFTLPSASYSARLGTPEHVGVIGAAFFPERAAPRWRTRPLPYSAPSRRVEAEAAPSADHGARSRDAATARGGGAGARPSPSRLGTEYGETLESRVQEVTFERESARTPAFVTRVRVDDRAGLEARGVRFEPPPYEPEREEELPPDEPDPFPGRRFAPPPP